MESLAGREGRVVLTKPPSVERREPMESLDDKDDSIPLSASEPLPVSDSGSLVVRIVLTRATEDP